MVQMPPMMQPAGAVPYVPTGYESLSADIQRKRAIADAMLNAKQPANMQSPLQALAQVFEAYGGNHLEKKADEQQADLDWQRQQQMQQVVGGITDALHKGATPGDIAQQYGANPQTANLPIVKAMMDTYAASLKNGAEVDGAPIQLQTENGIKTFQRMKDGTLKPVAEGTIANEKKLFNDVAVDPYAVKPGTTFPDFSKDMYIGPDGKPVLNQPLIGAKKDIAHAGATKVSFSPYIDASDKSFGKAIPEATVADLTKSRDAVLSYIQSKPELERAKHALNSGIFSGFAANTKLDLARAADAFGITGRSTAEKIANTQTFIQNMGRQTLPILQALRPASDTDVKTAQMMAGGDISLSPAAMRRAVQAAEEAGSAAYTQHKSRIKQLGQDYSNRPEIVQGIQTFDVPNLPESKLRPGFTPRVGVPR